jgi:chemotaxis response regulator CheB
VRNLMPVPGAPLTPAQMTPERAIEEFMMEAEDLVDEVPTNYMPVAPTSRRLDEAPAAELSLDVNEIDDMLSQVHIHAEMELTVPEREEPEMVVMEGDAAEFDAGLDLSALDAALDIERQPAPVQAKKSDAELLDEVLAGFDLGPDDGNGASNLADDDDDEPDYSVSAVSLDDGLDFTSNGDEMDADVAALSAQLDALDSGSPRGEVQDLSFIDFSDAPDVQPVPASAPAPAARAAPTPAPAAPVAPAAPAKGFSLDDLELSPLDAGLGGTPEFVKKKDFDFSALELSLEPTAEEIEAANAPAKEAASAATMDLRDLDLPASPVEPKSPMDPNSIDALFAAMDLAPPTARAPQASGISRVIVLGASIGGPDALRSFLGAIPENFPALFVLVQHLENGFFERLAQQLQKASKLPVRVPSIDKPARMGEVLVVAANQRIWVEPDGEIVMMDHAESPKYTPCIDDVLRDVADRFGGGATAIIFSGMAGDAIEGAVYLTTQGGEVWAQDPASCVVSSMVDGAKARGVVEFIGSPRELAERCVATYGNA